jgi:5-methylcytosine-specific restriction endonuclease McrA
VKKTDRNLVCEECGKSYIGHFNSRYCCEQCKKKVTKRTNVKCIQKWRKNPLNRKKEYQKCKEYQKRTNYKHSKKRHKKRYNSDPEYRKKISIYNKNNYIKHKQKRIKYIIDIRLPKLIKLFEEKGQIFTVNQLKTARRNWGLGVKHRDNYQCQRCGSKLNVQAHHIIPISQNITKMLDIDNGITLCYHCHVKHGLSIHSLYRTTYTSEQFWGWFLRYEFRNIVI